MRQPPLLGDVNGDSLTIAALTLPSWLTFTDNGDGTATLSGTPTNSNVGAHDVVLAVSDGIATVQQSFSINVANTNDAPRLVLLPSGTLTYTENMAGNGTRGQCRSPRGSWRHCLNSRVPRPADMQKHERNEFRSTNAICVELLQPLESGCCDATTFRRISSMIFQDFRALLSWCVLTVAVAGLAGCSGSNNAAAPSPPTPNIAIAPAQFAQPQPPAPAPDFGGPLAPGGLPGSDFGGPLAPGGLPGSDPGPSRSDGGAFFSAGPPVGGAAARLPASERPLLPGEVKHFRGHAGAVTAVAVRAGTASIFSGGVDRTLRVWDMTSGQAAGRWDAAEFAQEGRLAVCRNAPIAATSGHDGQATRLRIHDFATGEVRSIPLAGSAASEVEFIGEPLSQRITGLALSANGKRCFVCYRSGQLLDFDPQAISDPSSPANSSYTTPDGELSEGGTTLAISSDGRLLGTAGHKNVNGLDQPVVCIWNTGVRQLQMLLTTDAANGLESQGPPPSPEFVRAYGLGPPGVSSKVGSPRGLQALSGGGVMPGMMPGMGAGHRASLQSIDFAPETGFVAAGGTNKILYIWPLAEAEEGSVRLVAAARRLTGHSGEISGVAVLPDGKHVVSASRDGTIRFWNVYAGQEVHRLKADAPLRCLALASGGKQLVTGADTGMVSVWEVPVLPESPATGSLASPIIMSEPLPGLATLREAAQAQLKLAVGQGELGDPMDGIGPAELDWQLQSWVLGAQGPRALLRHHSGFAVFDARTAKLLKQVQPPRTVKPTVRPDGPPGGKPAGRPKAKKPVRALASQILAASMSSDAGRVVAAFGDFSAGAGSTENLMMNAGRADSSGGMLSPLTSPFFLAAWDAERGTVIAKISVPANALPHKIEVSPNGQFAIAGAPDAPTVLWNIAKGDLTASGPRPESHPVNVSFSPNGERFFGLVSRVRLLGGPAKFSRSPAGVYVPSGSAEIWRCVPVQRLGILKPDRGGIAAVALLPSGEAIVADVDASGATHLKVVEVETGKEVRRFAAPARLEPLARISALAVSSKGDYLASTSSLESEGRFQLQLWDVARGQECFHVESPQPWAHVSFSPDGQSFAAVREDGGMQWSLAAKAAGAGPSVPLPADEARTWSDKSGKFKITAQFVDIAGGDVRLRKADGEITSVAVDKLSDDDQAFLRQLETRPAAKEE